MKKSQVLFVLIALLLPLRQVRADDCRYLKPWLHARTALASGTTIADRARLQGIEWDQMQVSAAAAYQLYLSGQLQETTLHSTLQGCLTGNSDQQNFLDSLYSVFYAKSLDRLRASKSPAVQRLIQEFDRKNGNTLPIFRVMGYEEQTPAPLPGGYQRAIHSIYLNFGMVRPNDWLILFVHELLHSIDEQLWTGVQNYSQPDEVTKFAQWATQNTSISQLGYFQQNDLNSWILAGLDRGLLAEYRAWSATFEIYNEGLSEGLWNQIDWIETVLSPKTSQTSIEAFTFSYLDQHSPDPTDGIFSKPLIASALEDTRSRLRSASSPPPLANLESIVHDR